MEQRTCNIIVACKNNATKFTSKDTSTFNAIAKYMGDECAYPWELYGYRQMEDILLDALYDFIDGADKPSFELRQIFDTSAFAGRTLIDRIITMFALTKVRNKYGEYVNGFTQEILDEADRILGIERE